MEGYIQYYFKKPLLRFVTGLIMQVASVLVMIAIGSELSVLQQIRTAGIFIIMTFVVTMFTMKPWIPGLGMASQAFLNGVLAYVGIMRISIAQQVIFGFVYVLIIAFAVAIYQFDDQQVETQTTSTTPTPKPKAKKVAHCPYCGAKYKPKDLTNCGQCGGPKTKDDDNQ